MSDSLRPHGLKHAKLLCPPLSLGVCSNSRSLSQWCYLTISSTATLLSSCLQSFPASWSFPMSWFLKSDVQNIGTSASISVLPTDCGWFPLGLTGLIFFFLFLLFIHCLGLFIIYYQRIIALQNFIVFCQTSTWISHQFSSVTKSCPTLCDPMNRSTPGLPVHHQLPEFTQIHVHWVGDAVQPSHPLLSPSPPALNQP